MPRYEQLDNIRHRDLCVATGFGAHFGDNMAMVPVVPAEFRQLQREYTIFFRKDPAGGFQSVALLGFEPHENLYLQGARWVAASLPATIARGPFLIGFREHPGAAGPVREPVIHVDMAHPRVVAAGGQRVFQSDGSHSPYLDDADGGTSGCDEETELRVQPFPPVSFMRRGPWPPGRLWRCSVSAAR